jgi:predicted nucleic acid-binding protein
MNLYVDTSALIKNYVRETSSDQVIELLSQHQFIGTSAITQAEMASAMSKAGRLRWVENDDIESAWQDFISHWAAFIRLPLSTGIIEQVAALCWRYGLRAYDAIHLASALTWKDVAGDEVIFACFDQALTKAARKEGLQVWPE